jgi:uncharacterized protein (TIGR02246 family)
MRRLLGSAAIICGIVLCIPLLAEDEAPAIRAVVDKLNRAFASGDRAALLELFDQRGDIWVGTHRLGTARSSTADFLRARAVWDEASPSQLSVDSIRFLTPDWALVDATAERHGSVILTQTAHFLLVLERREKSWVVVSMRIIHGWPPELPG